MCRGTLLLLGLKRTNQNTFAILGIYRCKLTENEKKIVAYI